MWILVFIFHRITRQCILVKIFQSGDRFSVDPAQNIFLSSDFEENWKDRTWKEVSAYWVSLLVLCQKYSCQRYVTVTVSTESSAMGCRFGKNQYIFWSLMLVFVRCQSLFSDTKERFHQYNKHSYATLFLYFCSHVLLCYVTLNGSSQEQSLFSEWHN